MPKASTALASFAGLLPPRIVCADRGIPRFGLRRPAAPRPVAVVIVGERRTLHAKRPADRLDGGPARIVPTRLQPRQRLALNAHLLCELRLGKPCTVPQFLQTRTE